MSTGRPLGRKAGIAPGRPGGRRQWSGPSARPTAQGPSLRPLGLLGLRPSAAAPARPQQARFPKGPARLGTTGRRGRRGGGRGGPGGGGGGGLAGLQARQTARERAAGPVPGPARFARPPPPPRAAGRSPAQNLSLPDEQEGAPPGALGACWNGAAKNQGIPHGVCPKTIGVRVPPGCIRLRPGRLPR